MTEATTQNGRRVAISLPGYEGQAGFVEGETAARISFKPTKQRTYPAGTKIMIDGDEWELVAAVKSDFVAGYLVLTVRRAGGA